MWDDNGNPTVYKGAGMSFDIENRLTAVGSILTVGYNGDDLRAWKQTASGRTYFLYDGESPIIEIDSAGNVLAVNTYGDSSLLSRRSGSMSSFYTFDQQGNTSQRLDAAQGISASLTFDGYGTGAVTGTADAFGYNALSGYFTDIETGLHSLSYRYYDAGTGRFLNRDPADYDGGINLYSYIQNGPVLWEDSDGLFPQKLPKEGKKLTNPGDLEEWKKWLDDWKQRGCPNDEKAKARDYRDRINEQEKAARARRSRQGRGGRGGRGGGAGGGGGGGAPNPPGRAPSPRNPAGALLPALGAILECIGNKLISVPIIMVDPWEARRQQYKREHNGQEPPWIT